MNNCIQALINNKPQLMKYIFLLFASFHLFSFSSTAQWLRRDTGISGNVNTMITHGSNLVAGTDSFGAYISADNGTSWSAISTGLTTVNVRSLASNGVNLFAGTEGGGVFLSTDNGANWDARNTGLGNLFVRSLYINAATTTILAGTSSGLYRSTDNGANWSIATGLTTGAITSFSALGTAIYAGTGGGGIYKSTDSGASWAVVNNGLFNFDIRSFATLGSKVFAGTEGGIYTSTDAGANWTRLTDQGAPLGIVTSLAVRASTIFAGTLTGNLMVSTNSGVSWFSADFPFSTVTVFSAGAPLVFATHSGGGMWARPFSEFVVVESFSPTSGTTGSNVTINGFGFSPIPANNIVSFNGSAASSVTSASATSLSVVVPVSASTGPIDVSVGALTGRSSTDFTYIPLHTVTGFSPTSGPVGTSVTITGTGFSTTPANNTVRFNGNIATVTASTATSITAIVPAGDATGFIAVVVNSLTVLSNPNVFNVDPTITGFTPSSGAIGTSVTITGTNFDAVPGGNTVRFNGTAATVTASTATSITTTVPVGAITGPISVTRNSITGTSASNFSVTLPPPTISSFTPGSGLIGATVTITGTNFSTTPANNSVSFNGTTATVSASTATSITTTVPVGATTGTILVTVNSLTAISASNFTVTTPPPTISSFTPASGIVGTTVTIAGTNFSTTLANNNVSFNGAAATIIAATSTSITTTVPAGATTGTISVAVNSFTATSASTFTVIPSPTIASFSPSSGVVGTTITITGTNFSATPANNSVSFNGTAATVSASTATSITTTVPTGATTGAISVTVNSLTATSSSNFTVTLPPPTITSFSPLSGAAGTTVSITGTNFSTAPVNNIVKFNGTTAVVTASTATSITTTVPTGATTGTISVAVNSVTATSSTNFTVIDSTPPLVTNKTPDTVAQGSDIAVVATLSDAESGIVSANLLYRSISAGGNFTSIAMIAGGDYTQTIPAASVGELGVEYKFEVTNGVGLTNNQVLNTVRVTIAGDGVVIPYTAPGIDASNYRIVSVPLELTAKSVGQVFDELGPLDDTKWRMSHFQNGTNSELNLSSSIEPGQGYWLIAKEDPGAINSGSGVTVNATSISPFQINLAAGWNQIGNPYNFNISWADVQAANSGLSGLRKYDGSFADASILNKMEGGFVNVPSARTLVFPAVKNAAANGGRIAQDNYSYRNQLDEKSWQVYINLSQGNHENKIAGFGMHEKASEQDDPFDGLTMPRFFGEWLEVNHTKKNSRGFYSKDIVPSQESHTWEFVTETSSSESAMKFSWDNSYFGNVGPELYLWDVALQRSVNMRTTDSYKFSRDRSKSFKVVFGSSSFIKGELAVEETVLHDPWPNPAQKNEMITISFSTPESMDVHTASIEVNDMIGRSVFQFEKSIVGGYHEVAWERSADVTPGFYVISLRAGSTKRQAKVLLR